MKRVVVFVKNPVAGQVKTRLAAQIGHSAALAIYKDLVKHTAQVCQDFPHAVYYSQEVMDNDDFKTKSKHVQQGANLGDRMRNALQEGFSLGYTHQILIGSDLPELSSDLLSQAFYQLNAHEIVIGPAQDGGYYLIGMRAPYKEVFEKIAWSTNQVLAQTLQHCKDYSMLKTLTDIDTHEDLKAFPKLQKHIYERTN